LIKNDFKMPTRHLLIRGKVQGVFYRASAKKIADRLNIKGWIRNTPQGDVESLITGAEDKINEFISWCRTGPEDAEVEAVEIGTIEETTFNAFEIIRGG
jgi:acylphosphatase